MNIAIDAVHAIKQDAARILDCGEFLQPSFEIPHLMEHDPSAVVALAVERDPDRAGPDLLDFADAGDEDLWSITNVHDFCIVHDFPTPMIIGQFFDCIKRWPFHATVDHNSVIFTQVSRENPWVVYLLCNSVRLVAAGCVRIFHRPIDGGGRHYDRSPAGRHFLELEEMDR